MSTFRVIERTDPRLGRHVNHDDRSKAYAFRAPVSSTPLVSVTHERKIPILDQGQLGSCTGNAITGALGTVGLWDALPAADQGAGFLDEDFAVSVYSDATKIDSAPGSYPPDDTGSDGLSVAKVVQKRGLISGYQHTFTLADALAAIQVRAVIIGVTWYQSMFTPSSAGLLDVDASSGVAGGHEIVVRGYDAEQKQILGDNSWGTSWGANGSWRMAVADFSALLDDQGDVTMPLPLTEPAPTPQPVAAYDVAAFLKDALPWPVTGTSARTPRWPTTFGGSLPGRLPSSLSLARPGGDERSR